MGQFYDDILRPTGLRNTQYSLLVAIKLSGPVLVTKLAEYTLVDRTTLTRNLEILSKQGLINIKSGDDRRTRMVTITKDGLAILAQAYPLWEQAQAKIRSEMGHEHLKKLLESLSDLVAATQK